MNRRSFLACSVSVVVGISAPAVFAAERSFNHHVVAQAQKGAQTYLVKAGDTWNSVFGHDAKKARYHNRQNIQLESGQYVLSLPGHSTTELSLSPLPLHLDLSRRRQLIVRQSVYAWGLYEAGMLLRWGPAICGGDWCADVERACKTPTGTFTVSELAGPDRRSGSYPREEAAEGRGALMPYFMRLTDYGVGLHARYVRGRHETHGCVGLFYDDAMWLNTLQRTSGVLRVKVEM